MQFAVCSAQRLGKPGRFAWEFTPLSHLCRISVASLSHLCRISVASLWYLRCTIAVTPLSSICGISVTSLAYTCRISVACPSHLRRISVASLSHVSRIISVVSLSHLCRSFGHIASQTPFATHCLADPFKMIQVHPRHAWPGARRRIGRRSVEFGTMS